MFQKNSQGDVSSLALEAPSSGIGAGDQYVNFPQLLRNRLLKIVTWNEVERAWLRLKKEAVDGTSFSLQKGLEYRLKESFTGCFLHHLNANEATTPELQQKKLDIAQFLLRINEFPTVYKRRNDYTENIMSLLINSVAQSKSGIVTESSILKNMPSLRLAGSKIRSMDYTLKECSGLEALILTANYITDFDGVVLPQNLKLLELYGNLLYDIDLLAKNAPKKILFMGLGRNYLSAPTSIKLLHKYLQLCYLDLSDNDFEDIDELVNNLKALQRLKSLLLVGNPCTVISNYKGIVAAGLPNLELLDGVELNPGSAFLAPAEDEREAILQVYGFRFFGIPKPKRHTPLRKHGVESFYQMEIELPLLDDKLAEYESNVLTHELNGVPLPIVPETDVIPKTVEKPSKRNPSKAKSSVLSRKPKKSDSVTFKVKQDELDSLNELDEKYYEYLCGDEEIFMAKKFLSNKVQWAPVMKFSNPALSIPVPLENIRMLRDTFRTVINIRLYHKEEKVSSAVKSRSHVSVHKPRYHSLKRKSSKRLSIKVKKTSIVGPGGDQRDSISNSSKTLARRLICKIPVPLQMTNWSEDYMGYTWDIKDHCLAKPCPNLKNIVVGGVRPRRSRRSVGWSKREVYMPTPKILTCHIGVGVKRPGAYERMQSTTSRLGRSSAKRTTRTNSGKGMRRHSSKANRASIKSGILN